MEVSQLFLSETAACMPMLYEAFLCHNWNARLQKFTIGKKKDFPQVRESSFNMTRGGGDEDIETRSLKF